MTITEAMNATALDTFKRAFQWMSTATPDALSLLNPWPELVAEMEAEGAALIGAKPCEGARLGVPHGLEWPEPGPDGYAQIVPALDPCPFCGAAV